MSLTPRVGIVFVVFWAVVACIQASVWPRQEGDNASTTQPQVQTSSATASDFEVKFAPDRILVRRKGTEEWIPSQKLTEPVVVGVLDGGRKIYVLPDKAKSIKLPKAKHMVDPEFPESAKDGKERVVSLHMVLDERGVVRSLTVDASPGPEYAKSAVEALRKWVFEPAKFNGQSVAVLFKFALSFRFYSNPFPR